MTKEITKAFILQQMQDKFGMREYEKAKFLFSEIVVPTYNIGQHLLTPDVKSATESITATGIKIFFTVPQNEKWHLHGYNVVFMTGVYTIAGTMILRPDWFYLDLAAAIAASYCYNLPKDVILHPGDSVSVNVDGYTSTGDLSMRLDVTVEDIR